LLKERPPAEAAAPAASAAAAEPPASAEPEIVTMEEASMAHVGEWVLFRITGHDPETNMSIGEVLMHHRSQREISKAHTRAWKADPKVKLAIILGGTRRLRNKEDFLAMIDEARQKPYVNVNW
jgi:hypothetical protein